MANLVVLGQKWLVFVYRDPPEKSDPSHLAFQGHLRSLEPVRIVRLPLTFCWYSVVTMRLSRTVSEINGDICKTFPPPCI